MNCSVAQSVASPIADPGLVSSILAQPHTFMEIYLKIFSTAILLLPLIQEGLLSVTSESLCTEYWLMLSLSVPRKNVYRLTDHLNMTVAGDSDV